MMFSEVTKLTPFPGAPSEDIITPTGLYVHWPFCTSKCPYCDFNSHVSQRIEESKWYRAYENALFSAARSFSTTSPLQTIFFGGGTPSLMSPGLVKHILDVAKQAWGFSPKIEITLEANPGSLLASHLEGYLQAGVNRLSIGIQSFREEGLSFLGRRHSVTQGKEAIRLAQSMLYNLSLDLIYAHPKHSLSEWEKELNEALEFELPHYSLYQLTIEPSTPFFQAHSKGKFTMPDDEKSRTFYTHTHKILENYGLPSYEVSNFARPGFQCQHNENYWWYHNFVGVGPGAHGRIGDGINIYATTQHKAPEKWLESALSAPDTLMRSTSLTFTETLAEKTLMALRLNQGIPYTHLIAQGQEKFWAILGPHKQKTLAKEGYIRSNKEVLELTWEGRLRLNSILTYLFADLA